MPNEDKDAKLIRIKEKMEAALVDVAMDMYEPDDLKELRKLVSAKLRSAKAGTSVSYIRAFIEGFEFGMVAQDQNQGVPALAGMRLILKEEDAKMAAKVDEATGTK